MKSHITENQISTAPCTQLKRQNADISIQPATSYELVDVFEHSLSKKSNTDNI